MFVFKPILLLMKEMKLILKKLLFGEKNSKENYLFIIHDYN